MCRLPYDSGSGRWNRRAAAEMRKRCARVFVSLWIIRWFLMFMSGKYECALAQACLCGFCHDMAFVRSLAVQHAAELCGHSYLYMPSMRLYKLFHVTLFYHTLCCHSHIKIGVVLLGRHYLKPIIQEIRITTESNMSSQKTMLLEITLSSR